MEIELFKFSKRINSTKKPSAGSGFTTQCTIKQNAPYVGTFGSSSDTTVCFPVLFLTNVNDPNQYNYCRTFGNRYYFIKDIQIDINGAATLHCEIDVLATRKSEILNSNQFVLYSSSDYNAKISDPRIPKEVGYNIKEDDGYLGIPFATNPLYILNCVSTAANVSNTYILSSAGIRDLATWLTDPANSSIMEQISKWAFKAQSAILSISVCPFNISASFSDNVVIGHAITSITGKKVDYTDTFVKTGALSVTPEESEITYLDGEMYSTYRVYVPYCGYMTIPANLLIQSGSLDISYMFTIEYGTGKCYCSFRTMTYDYIGMIEGSAYTPLPWGDLGNPLISTALSGATAILGTMGINSAMYESASGGAYDNMVRATGFSKNNKGTATTRFYTDTEGDIAGYNNNAYMNINFGAMGNSVISGFNESKPIVSGGTGGSSYSAYLHESNILYQKFTNKLSATPDSYTQILGRPLNKYTQLSDLSGFCQCKNPSIEIDDLKTIAELINGYLSGGFFIE